jgi:hypothetical protein
MAGNFNLEQTNSYESGLEAKIAGNNAVLDMGEAVSLTGGFIVKTGAGVDIEWVSTTTATFAANNQTVAKRKATYRPAREGDHYLMRTIGTGLVFDAALVASNTINLNVNGVAMTEITYGTSNDATLEAIATQLATQFPSVIAAAVRSGTRTVAITVVPGQTVTLTGIIVAAGASQADGAQANYFVDANVGKFFDIASTSQFVDWPTEHATEGQLRLEQAKSQSYAVFSIANA